MSKEVKDKIVSCPFCGESDFDLVGLKYHFGLCKAYFETVDWKRTKAKWKWKRSEIKWKESQK